MSDTVSLIKIISKDFELAEGMNFEQLRNTMISAFAYLIENDFQKLIQILYRADVDQDKLKGLLEHSENSSSAEVIADTYLNRQLAKVETWKKYSKPADNLF